MRATRAGPEQLGTWADEMIADLDQLLTQGVEAAGAAGADGPALSVEGVDREAPASRITPVRDLTDGGLAIRHHGDLHLGQMLRTDDGWVILDFEGEPARDVEARRRHASPLRDVAGMMRSFDYAAAAALLERRSPRDSDWDNLQAFGDTWAAVNREAFWDAYLSTVGASGLLPEGETVVTMLRAFETQKAVYEAGYELRHRPDWAWIPLRFLREST